MLRSGMGHLHLIQVSLLCDGTHYIRCRYPFGQETADTGAGGIFLPGARQCVREK